MIRLPYADQVIQPLKELVLQDEFSELPDIQIKQHSDFGLITSNITSLAALESLDVSVEATFDTIGEYVKDNTNIVRLQSLEYTSKSFAQSIEDGYMQIDKVVTPVVDKIKENVHTRFEQLMIREKAESLLDNQVEPSESDYTILRWKHLTSPMKQREVVDMACENARIKNRELSKMNTSYVVQKSNHIADFKELKLPKEVDTLISDRLVAALASQSDITPEQIKKTWRFLTDKMSYDFYCNSFLSKYHDKKNVVNHCLELIDTAVAFNAVISVVQSVASDELSTEALQNLVSNIDTVHKTMYATEYWLLSEKEIQFKNKLILTPHVLNGQVYDEFILEGKTISDIHNYLKVFHTDITVPTSGIALESVKNTDTEALIGKTYAKLRSKRKTIMTQCLNSAYDHAIALFVKDEAIKKQYPQLNTPNFVSQFVSVAKNKCTNLNGNIANLDNVLYDLVLLAFHKNTLVDKLYKNLDKHFVKLTESSVESIDDDTIMNSQCDAVCELLVDYLFDTLVEKKAA